MGHILAYPSEAASQANGQRQGACFALAHAFCQLDDMQERARRGIGFGIFDHKGELKATEKQIQQLFRWGWRYSEDFLLISEVNNFHGPVDFMVIYSPKDVVLIEIKKAVCESLESNIRCQVPTYEADHDGAPCITVIFTFSEKEKEHAESVKGIFEPARQALIFIMDFSKRTTSASKIRPWMLSQQR